MKALRFGRYDLAERIGTGGMAETWLARFAGPAGVQKSVVLKRIRPELAGDAQFTRMFINEARIASALSHGNIAQVFDFGEIDGEYFLAMEHVDGQPLSRVLRAAHKAGLVGLPVPFALYIAARMSEGLHYAHTRVDEQGRPLGLVHRDVSPDNVMISFDGQVKVIDFGIAKAVANDTGNTQAGVMKGKALYASPEQIKLEKLDRRTDVYSTGVVLYLMLAGRLPFEGQRFTVLERILAGDWISPRLVNPQLPVEAEKLVYDAMATDRDARLGSSQRLAESANGLLSKLAPSFSANLLEQLMSWLFTDELAKRGREAHVDDGFTSQLTAWKSAVSSAPSHVTLAPSTGSGAATAAETGSQARPTPLPSWVRWAAAGSVVAAFLALVLSVLHVRTAQTTLIINTAPLLAEVSIDGVAQPRGSPLRAEVSKRVPHHLEVKAEGFETFVTERIFDESDEEHVDIRLDRIVKPPPEQAANPTPDPIAVEPDHPTPEATQPPPDEPLPVEASYPLLSFRLSTLQHVVVPIRSEVAVVALKPGVPYTVSTEGAYTYGYTWTSGKNVEGTSVNSTNALYFVEGGTGTSFGEVGPRALTVRGKNLYLFLPDNAPTIRKGTLRVNVRPAGGAPQVVLLDPTRNALRPDPQRRFALHKLDPRIIYRFELRPLPGGATLGASGRADRIVCMRATSGLSLGDASRQPRIEQVLEVGKPVEMTRVRELTCMLFDDRLDDNKGELEVKVVSLGVQPNDAVAMFEQFDKTGRISLYGVEFELGSDKITPASEKYLMPIKQQLEREPQVQLSIEGHTDDTGLPAANEALSLQRAESVKRWFVSHGIAPARLTAKGFGSRQPVADNALEEGRALNRRVDLVKR